MNEDLDNCRDCGHFKFLHVPGFKGALGFDQHCDPQNDHGCDCFEYIPEDNLDYIEWLAQKRGLV